MAIARNIYMVVAWLFVLAIAIQFFLAGLGVMGGESLDAHRDWGFIVLHLIPILMLIMALVARLGRTMILLTLLTLVLVFIQPFFADPEIDPLWIRSFHILVALFIAALAYCLAQASTRMVRAGA